MREQERAAREEKKKNSKLVKVKVQCVIEKTFENFVSLSLTSRHPLTVS